jgi:hypothetical protein
LSSQEIAIGALAANAIGGPSLAGVAHSAQPAAIMKLPPSGGKSWKRRKSSILAKPSKKPP